MVVSHCDCAQKEWEVMHLHRLQMVKLFHKEGPIPFPVH